MLANAKCVASPWGAVSIILMRTAGFFLWGEVTGDLNVAIHTNLVPRLNMRRTIPTVPIFSRCGILVELLEHITSEEIYPVNAHLYCTNYKQQLSISATKYSMYIRTLTFIAVFNFHL